MIGHKATCAGCGTAFHHEGVTNNDNSGRLWHSRECKDAFLRVTRLLPRAVHSSIRDWIRAVGPAALVKATDKEIRETGSGF